MALKAHIIQVIADAGPGGAPTHVANLIRGLATVEPNIACSLIAPQGWLTEAVQDVANSYPAALTSAIGRTSHSQFVAALSQAQSAHPDLPTLIHFHGVRAGTLGYLQFRYRNRRNVPRVVYTEHLWTRDYHLPNRLRELLQLRLLSGVGHRADRVIVVSGAVQTFFLERKLAPADRMVVIPNGVALPELDKNNQKIGNKSKSVTYQIGSIGALVPLKGYDTLIEAMPLVLQNHPDTQLAIVGDGPDKTRLKNLADKYHLRERVKFMGNLTNPSDELRRWRIFVSTSHSESFGLAIAEAMAQAVPVVATSVGGVPELVTSETGRLVPPRDPHMLAKAIIDLLSQPELCVRLGTAARARIEKYFTLNQMVKQTVQVYADVLKNS